MRYVLFPYERIPHNSRVIIYGMGWLGKIFVEQITLNNYCELVFAVDKNYLLKNNNLIAVRSLEAIKEAEYDYIVIALLSVSEAELVKEYLVNQGVPAEKCIYKHKIIELGEGQILPRIRKIESFLNDRVSIILHGLESYAENECWRRSCPDWKNSWINKKMHQLQKELYVYKIEEYHKFIRVGHQGDGGYIIVNDYPSLGDKVLYSFGVGNDVSFEYEMAERGWQIYMYDHTVNKLPQNHNAFHYKKLGLIGVRDEARPELLTLLELLRDNGHIKKRDMFLKMDIEGYEINVFRHLNKEVQLQFAQIVLELHGLDDISLWDAIIETMNALKRTHTLVHLHANNCGPMLYIGDGMVANAVELTFVRTSDWHFLPTKGLLLNPIDRRCASYRPEFLAWQGDS